MAVVLVNHAWKKIIERDSYSKQALRDRIEAVKQLEESVRLNDGADAARTVLKDGLIIYALERCLENLEGSTLFSEKDFWVFYEFATTAARNAEDILNEDDGEE